MSWDSTTPTRGRRRGGRWVGLGFLIVGVAVVVLVGVLVLYGRAQLDAPDTAPGRDVTIQVREGESVDDVIRDLDREHVIRSPFWFGLYARVKSLGSDIRPGDHAVNTSMGATAVIVQLENRPAVVPVSIVLPEGLRATQMADRVAASGVGITAAQYLQEAQHGHFDEPFLSSLPPGTPLEGFLFPDTYAVPKGTSAHDLVQMQLDDFAAKAQPLLQPGSASGLNSYQVLNLASIVEREAQQDADRPLVAGVYVNRLQQGMRLEVDAAVSYGLGVTREPTPAELQQDGPYNTYRNTGLPPTPISNPGLASIRAAVTPAKVTFLFYVSDGCGKNHYANTVAEQQRNVQLYVGKPCGA